MSISTADLMNQRGAPSAFNKHTPIGAFVQGTVRSADVLHCKDPVTKKPEHWDDGRPKLQLRIVISTAERNPQDPNDNGDRAIYIKSWGENWRRYLEAADAAGIKDITNGCQFFAQYEREEPSNFGSPAKLFIYRIQAAPTAAGQLMAQQPPPQQQAAYAPPPAPAAPPAQQWGAPPAHGYTPPPPPPQQAFTPQPPPPINPADPYSPGADQAAAAYQTWQQTQQ